MFDSEERLLIWRKGSHLAGIKDFDNEEILHRQWRHGAQLMSLWAALYSRLLYCDDILPQLVSLLCHFLLLHIADTCLPYIVHNDENITRVMMQILPMCVQVFARSAPSKLPEYFLRLYEMSSSQRARCQTQMQASNQATEQEFFPGVFA